MLRPSDDQDDDHDIAEIAAEMDFVHTGPGTVAGKYLRRFWQPVFVSAQLQTGYAVPIRIMGEDFTLYRGASGAAYVVDFRCAHRGTQLSVGWVEQDCIRCFYHGWKYDGTGQCVEQPAEDASFAKKITIRSCPTHEFLGLIFAYFGDGVAPPFPDYPELNGRRRDRCRQLHSPLQLFWHAGERHRSSACAVHPR